MSLMPRSRLMRRLGEVADGRGDGGAGAEQRAAPPGAVEQAARPRARHRTTQVSTEPAKPSQDFLGLTDGAIGCLPSRTPKA